MTKLKPESWTAMAANKSEHCVEWTFKPCIVGPGPYSESMNLLVAKLHDEKVLDEKLLY